MKLVPFQPLAVHGTKDGGDLIPRHGRDGRPKIFPEGGGKGAWYTRTTTFIDCLSDKSNLADWKLRKLLLGIDMRPAIMQDYRELEDPEGQDKGRVRNLVEYALKIAGIGDKADIGTAMHSLTEDLDAGDELDWSQYPPDVADDLKAYLEATKGLRPVAIEVFCVLDEYEVAGTFDRAYEVIDPALAAQLGVEVGTVVVGDIKTGSVDFDRGKITMQLAAYQMMKGYDPETYERKTLTFGGKTLDPSVGLIVHLPAGEGVCRVIPVDLEKGREGLALAQKVREWRKFWGRKASKAEPLVSAGLTT